MRADNVKAESEIIALTADAARVENKLEAFRETVDDRFDQTIELLKSNFRSLKADTESLKQC